MLSSAVSSKTAVSQAPSLPWFFLIKVPYLGKLSVMYDAKNKGFSKFSSSEIKSCNH